MSKKLFQGVSNAKMSERGEYLEEGEYELEIKRCIIKDTRERKTLFIVEMKVLESDNAKHPAGTDRNWVQKMFTDSTDGNLKAFVLAALGIDRTDKAKIAEVEEELPNVLSAALDDPSDPECKNELKGFRVHCKVKATTTKDGKPFNAHTFSPSTKQAA